MKLTILFLIAILYVSLASADNKEFVVIGTSELSPQSLSRSEVVDIYMGRMKRLKNGTYLIPVDIQTENPMRSGFYHELMDKNLSEINSYWARLVFTGRGVPPRQAESVDEIIEIIKHNKGAIGYVPLEAVTDDVHILYRVAE